MHVEFHFSMSSVDSLVMPLRATACPGRPQNLETLALRQCKKLEVIRESFAKTIVRLTGKAGAEYLAAVSPLSCGETLADRTYMLEAQAVPSGLSDLIRPSDVHLELRGASQPEVLSELVRSLTLSSANSDALVEVLQRRESMGSTGVGHGVAVPHCRTSLADRIRIVFGRHPAGVPWCGADGEPVRFFFLLIAPPVEVSNAYLPVLGKVAGFVNSTDNRQRLAEIQSPPEFLDLIARASL
jgi:PTS system nitrogen regulatory IIA component